MWGAISGLAAAAGVFLGGVLTEGPGWRWVLFVNLPVCAGIIVTAGISSQLFARIGTRPVIVAGALIAAAGVWYLSRIPVNG